MRSAARTRRRLLGVGVVSAVVAVAASLAPGAAAKGAGATGQAADAHKCLVMTGSGDAAFTHSFNPYTGPTLNGNIMKGAIYEPLLVATVAGGGHVYPWLASSWKWSNANKTLTLQIVKNAKWSDGQAAHARRRRLQPDRGQAGQDDGHHRPDPRRAPTSRRSSASGPNGVAINLKTPDSQFIAANLNLQFVVPQHIWSKVKKVATFTNPNPVGSGPFDQIGRLTNQDIVFNKNPSYWVAGGAEGAVPRVPGDGIERRGPARHPERQGRLDAQLRAERRVRVRGQGSRPLPRVLLDDGVPDLAHVRRHGSTRSASCRCARRSACRSTAPTSRSSASTATRRRPTRSA